MEFRIGVNLGDVTVEGDRIYGEGINIAARLERLADPGAVCVSAPVCVSTFVISRMIAAPTPGHR